MDDLEKAYNNSYLLATKQVKYEDLLVDKEVFFIHNPDSEITEYDLKKMIRYYESIEYYERCAELKKILDS